MDKQYDIFISCKSEDYEYGHELYDFFTNNGFYTFFAPKSIKGGDLFEEVIFEAIETAKYYVVFTTNPAYLKTYWLLNGIKYRKACRPVAQTYEDLIYFILKGVKNDSLPGIVQLICHGRMKSFQYEKYKRILKDFQEI